MNNRIVLLMLMSLLVFSVTACGGNEDVVEATAVSTLDQAVIVEVETAVSQQIHTRATTNGKRVHVIEPADDNCRELE